MPDIVKVELESLKDLIKINCGLRYPLIYKCRKDDKDCFLLFYSVGETVIIPYIIYDKKVDEEYIIYDTMSGKFRFSNTPSTNPKEMNIAIIRLKKQPFI
ncbi:MAG TPA: hypothetical protein ENF87_00715 [Thermoproteales archaeon]|nr:hypothetical protein [Thermoproteales archaeon]